MNNFMAVVFFVAFNIMNTLWYLRTRRLQKEYNDNLSRLQNKIQEVESRIIEEEIKLINQIAVSKSQKNMEDINP